MNIITRLILAASVLLLGACTQIDTGNVGVERTLGKVSPDPKPPGIYLTIFDSVDEFTTKEVSFQLNDLTPKSEDSLTMKDVDIDIYFKVAPQSVPGLFVKYQGDVVKHKDVVEGGNGDLVIAYSRVSRGAREAVYKAISSFQATTMHTKRTELSETIRQLLQRELDANDEGAFLITAVNVRNLLTDPAIEASIRQRAQTDQDIARKQKEVELEKAEAERLLVQATGEAAANRAISESLTPQLVELRLAELQRDTALAIAGKEGNVILMGGNATPLVSIK